MSTFNYYEVVADCENDLRKYGDTFEGMGWTKKNEYADLRYRIMTELFKTREADASFSLLDIGCGTGRLYQYLQDRKLEQVAYSGLDLSPEYLTLAIEKFPEIRFYKEDLLQPRTALPKFDYTILNGVFTYKGTQSEDAMWDYVRMLLKAAWNITGRGLAFNVMTKYLDWEREDLFYLPFDQMASFVAENLSRSFTVRHDYGLYEYTVYVYRTDLSDEL